MDVFIVRSILKAVKMNRNTTKCSNGIFRNHSLLPATVSSQ